MQWENFTLYSVVQHKIIEILNNPYNDSFGFNPVGQYHRSLHEIIFHRIEIAFNIVLPNKPSWMLSQSIDVLYCTELVNRMTNNYFDRTALQYRWSKTYQAPSVTTQSISFQ